MAVIIVGGQTKNVGKTTLICHIIVAFPSIGWIAVKISNHLHIPQDSKQLARGDGWGCWEQNPTTDHNDTARFLRAGAVRALLLQAENSSLEFACAGLDNELASAKNVIVESASAAEWLDPDLLLILLDPSQDDFKVSAKQQLDRADGIVLGNSDLGTNERVSHANPARVFTAFSDRLDPRLRLLLEEKIGSLPQAARSG